MKLFLPNQDISDSESAVPSDVVVETGMAIGSDIPVDTIEIGTILAEEAFSTQRRFREALLFLLSKFEGDLSLQQTTTDSLGGLCSSCGAKAPSQTTILRNP